MSSVMGDFDEFAASDVDAQGEDGCPVSEDDVFNVLSNCRRRQVIQYLCDHEGEASVGELAEYIATEENDTTLQQLTSTERKSVYVSLYQNHLPVMDDAGVVDYEENRKVVRLLEGASRVEPYLADVSRAFDDRRATATALAAAGCVLLGGLQVGPFAALPPTVWTILGVVVLVGVVCFDAWRHSSGSLRERLTASA